MSVAEIFEGLRARVLANPEKVATLTGSYQFEVTGDDGGLYFARFAGGTAEIGPGAIEGAGCTVTISAADFISLVGGKLNPTTAFMTGKLKLKGDMGLAMKLQTVLS